MQAIFVIKEKFGIERIYPENETAKTLCSLTGMKTLERRYIKDATSLGITINLQAGGQNEVYKPAE